MSAKRPDRALLWAERRRETKAGAIRGVVDQPRAARGRPKRERWAIAAMFEDGRLSIPAWTAALRLKRLLDASRRPAESRFEFASRTTTDPAGAAYTAILARLAAGDALSAAQGSDEWANRQRVVRAAFDGEPSLGALVRLYCESSRNVERVRRILARACEALQEHWTEVDAGRFRPHVE